MAGLSASPALTPMVLQSVAAMIVVALLATVGLVVVYSVVAGGLAWVLVVIIGLLRLLLAGIGRTWSAARDHLRARGISPENVPDLRVRPLG
jgi:hypothetical protein